MAAASGKTVATPADPAAFIDAIADPGQQGDARTLCATMARLAAAPPVMWGPSIIGFGRYRYRYESGREGEMCRIGFSPRKGRTIIYFPDGDSDGDHAADLARLGRHKTGKACLHVRRLADIDLAVLEAMIARSLTSMAQKYPE